MKKTVQQSVRRNRLYLYIYIYIYRKKNFFYFYSFSNRVFSFPIYFLLDIYISLYVFSVEKDDSILSSQFRNEPKSKSSHLFCSFYFILRIYIYMDFFFLNPIQVPVKPFYTYISLILFYFFFLQTFNFIL